MSLDALFSLSYFLQIIVVGNDTFSSTTDMPYTPPTPCFGYPCSDRSKCILPYQICDGHNDCHPLHEDEQNCE